MSAMASASGTPAHGTSHIISVLHSPSAIGKRRRSEAMTDDVISASDDDGHVADEDEDSPARAMDVCTLPRTPAPPPPGAYDIGAIDSTPSTAMALFM